MNTGSEHAAMWFLLEYNKIAVKMKWTNQRRGKRVLRRICFRKAEQRAGYPQPNLREDSERLSEPQSLPMLDSRRAGHMPSYITPYRLTISQVESMAWSFRNKLEEAAGLLLQKLYRVEDARVDQD